MLQLLKGGFRLLFRLLEADNTLPLDFQLPLFVLLVRQQLIECLLMFIDSQKSLLRRLSSVLVLGTMVPVGLYFVADRRVGDLLRLVRASADLTVDGLEA
ncbi:MAG: hypothetical protein ACK5UC_21675 [Planctomycetaceae bacterium]